MKRILAAAFILVTAATGCTTAPAQRTSSALPNLDHQLIAATWKNGADIHSLDSYRGTALIRAAERGHAAVVGQLLQAGVTVDHVNRLGWTALHEAVLHGKGTEPWQQIVRILLAAGANPNLPDGGQRHAPHHAETRGYDEIAATLRSAGAR